MSHTDPNNPNVLGEERLRDLAMWLVEYKGPLTEHDRCFLAQKAKEFAVDASTLEEILQSLPQEVEHEAADGKGQGFAGHNVYRSAGGSSGPQGSKSADPFRGVAINARYVLDGPVGGPSEPLYRATARGTSKHQRADAERKNAAGKRGSLVVEIGPADDSRSRTEWNRRCRLMKQAYHKNLLPCHENGVVTAGEFKGQLFLVTERGGDSLEDLLSFGRLLTVQDRENLREGLASALTYLHDHGITHGRVGPRWVARQGDVWALRPTLASCSSGQRTADDDMRALENLLRTGSWCVSPTEIREGKIHYDLDSASPEGCLWQLVQERRRRDLIYGRWQR